VHPDMRLQERKQEKHGCLAISCKKDIMVALSVYVRINVKKKEKGVFVYGKDKNIREKDGRLQWRVNV
jgi:hypothetical protein